MHKSLQTRLIIWLWSGIVLVTLMVTVGGITRLTGSGLSIVRWKIVTGVLPPSSDEEWNDAFAEYKETPQYKQINKNFTVDDFKKIYWWEYIHRIIGRVVGLVFIVPFLYFVYMIGIPRWLTKHLLIIFLIGAGQGVMGWVMVMSGLSDLPYVSHYRLAAHLLLAMLLVAAIIWTILRIKRPEAKMGNPGVLLIIGVILFIIQTTLGAFVAGLKAGFYYNTFPLMNGSFVPENLFASAQNGVFIQFIHRWLAFVFAGWTLVIWYHYRWKPSGRRSEKANSLAMLTIAQVMLGILTLLFKVPVFLGVLHQVVAVFILGILVAMVFEVSTGQQSVLKK